MSHIATKLNGLLRARQIFQHTLYARYSNVVYTTAVNKTIQNSRYNLPHIALVTNQQLHQQANNKNVAAPSTAVKPMFAPRSRKLKILKKLASNKVSLQFDKFDEIRPSLFRNYNISVEEGFEILRSCSQLVDRRSDERIKLVNQCWSELLPMIKEPTKNQFILLLQAYRRAGLKSLKNYQTFFQRYNCAIDADIFTELIYIACQNNESMEIAENLFKDVTAQNIEPTEKMYNALILGYSKQGIEAVENVVETMHSKNISPSLDTNTELIKAYLVNKMVEKAMKILCQSNEYSSDQLYEIIRCAAIERHEQLIETALNLLPETVRNAKLIVPQLQNVCTELVHLNCQRSIDAKFDPYRLIIRHLPVPTVHNNSEYGMFLLKEMIVANENVANILKLCNNLIEDNRNSYSIQNCCMYSLVFNLPIVYDFLKELATKEPLRPHYFSPLFVRSTNQTDVIEVIKFANKVNVIIDSMTLENYVLPRTNALADGQDTISALTSAGIRMLELKSAIIAFLLNENHPKEALDISHRSTSSIDPNVVEPAVYQFIRSPMYWQNASTITNLIRKLQWRCVDKQYDLAGKIVVAFCTNRDKLTNFRLVNQLITEYNRVGVKISLNAANLILDKIHKNRNVHDSLSPIIEQLIDDQFVDQDAKSQHTTTEWVSHTNEIDKLEQQLAEFKANNLPTHGILYRLLVKHVQLEQYDRAFEVKQQCDAAGVIETPVVMSTMLKLWTATDNPDKALDVLNRLKEQHPNFKLDSFKVIDLTTLLLKNSRIDDAKQVIADLPNHNGKSITNYLSNNIWHLLNAASQYSVEKGDDDNISEKFLQMLVAKRYAEHSNTLLGTVIKEYLEKKQIHKAVIAFQYYTTEYQKTPQSLSLLTLLIEISNDADSLGYAIAQQESINYIQQIIDLIKSIHGTENANVNIILAFACAGKEQQLRKILMNPTVKFNNNLLLKSLTYLKDRAKTEAVVALARSARGLNHDELNEENLYEILLSDFVRKNDYTAAIRLYEQIQCHENGVVSRKFTKTLVELLAKNNQPIPQALNVKAY